MLRPRLGNARGLRYKEGSANLRLVRFVTRNGVLPLLEGWLRLRALRETEGVVAMAAVYVARVPRPVNRQVQYRLQCLVEMLGELGIDDREDLQNILSCVAAVADFFNQGVLIEISDRLRKKANVLRKSDLLCDLHAAAALDDEAYDLDVERVLLSEREEDATEEELDEVFGDA